MTAPKKLAQDELVATLPRLRRYARVLTSDLHRADELVLDTLVGAWRRQHLWQQGTIVRTWLFTIMHRLHRKRSIHLRGKLSQMLTRAHDEAANIWQIPTRVTESSHAERSDILARLSRLPVEQREVLLLVVVEELSYGDIATLLGVSIETVMATLTSAREGMRLLSFDSFLTEKVVK
jgi:RNA polymerase sigma-70 factor, ECF subfamily